MNTFFKIICLCIFTLSNFSVLNSNRGNDYNTDTVFSSNNFETDSSGLYDQDILELYNSTKNIEQLYLKDNFQTYYFSSLADNIGNNTKGSCGFVAFGMILSFYDTYWDDCIVPEIYDNSSELVSESILKCKCSPGIIVEPDNLAYSNQQTYYSNISNYGNSYFHFKLLDLYKNNISDFPYNYESGKYSYGLGYKNYSDFYRYYLSNYLGLPKNAFTVHETTTSVRNEAIKLVKRGIPVRLSIRDNEQIHENHCIVAYDYDSTSDSLFCNFGWGENSTHVTIEQMEYEVYASLTAIELNTDHTHSNNYSIYDEYGELTQTCSCFSMIPTEIEISSNYLDVNPTFKWDSLIKEKWSKKDTLYHTLSIVRSNRYEVFQIDDIFDNEYTLTTQEWKKVINDVADPSYYVHITIGSDTYTYWDDFYCSVLFEEPNRYLLKSSFLPQDWGIEGRYYFQNELDSLSVSSEPDRMYATTTQNGLTINTERLRCGYIEKSYIVLSPRRKNAGRAYFEMNFDKPVYSFMYRACMWSASENLDGIAIIQTKDSSENWTTLKDIPISALKTKENGLTQFSEMTLSGIYGLRFETTATATGDRNKGRFCLGDIVFSTSLITGMGPYLDYDYII